MNNKKSLELKISADKEGAVTVLSRLGGNLRIQMPLSNKFCEQNTDSLDLSVRSRNALMRAGIDNVGKIVNTIKSDNGLLSIRNLGIRSMKEIKSVLLTKSYDELTDNEKLNFWEYVITENSLK